MLLVREESQMLYLVGLGLGDARDITVRGLEVVRAAHIVFLESYTSILAVDKTELVSGVDTWYCPHVVLAGYNVQRVINVVTTCRRSSMAVR